MAAHSDSDASAVSQALSEQSFRRFFVPKPNRGVPHLCVLCKGGRPCCQPNLERTEITLSSRRTKIILSSRPERSAVEGPCVPSAQQISAPSRQTRPLSSCHPERSEGSAFEGYVPREFPEGRLHVVR